MNNIVPTHGFGSIYNIKPHIFDTVHRLYGVASDAGAAAWSLVKSQYDGSRLAMQLARIALPDLSDFDTVSRSPLGWRDVSKTEVTTTGSAPGPVCSALSTQPPLVLCKPPPQTEAVYLVDEADSRLELRRQYLMDLLAVAILVIFVLLLRKYFVPAITKIRSVIVTRWKYLVGTTYFEAIVEQQQKVIDSLRLQVQEAVVYNHRLKHRLCDAREKQASACRAMEKQIAIERTRNAATLDRMDAVAASMEHQLELRDGDIEQLHQKHDDAQSRVAALLDEVSSLHEDLGTTQRTSTSTIASLRSRLQQEQQQHRRDIGVRDWETSRLQDVLRIKEAENADLQTGLRATEAKVVELVEAGLLAVQEIEEKDAKIASLKKEIVQRQDELSTLRSSHTELKEAHNLLQHHLAAEREESEKDKLAYETRCSQYEDQVADLTDRLECTEHRLDFAHHEYLCLVQDLPRRQALHDAETASLRETYERKVEELEHHLDGARRQLDFVDHEYRYLANDLPKQNAIHDQTISKLQHEHAERSAGYEADVARLNAQTKDLTGQVALLTAGRDVLAEKYDNFTKDFEELSERYELQTGRLKLLDAAFEDAMERSRQDKAALAALRAGRVVDEHYAEMLEEKISDQNARHKLLNAAFEDAMERARQDKAAIAALQAGKKVDEQYTEMLEEKLSKQAAHIADLEAAAELLTAERDTTVAMKDAIIAMKDATIAEKEAGMAEKDMIIGEHRDEIQQLHELLEEMNEEALQASREAQAARASAEEDLERQRTLYEIERDSLVEELNTLASSSSQPDCGPQSEPTLLRCLFERNLVERYERMVNDARQTKVIGLGISGPPNFPCPPTPTPSSSSYRPPFGNITNLAESGCAPTHDFTTAEQANLDGSQPFGVPETPCPTQQVLLLDGPGDLSPFLSTPSL